MQHLREVDPQHTVVVMQVENEVGLLGSARDYSPPAVEAWNSAIPAELLTAIEANDLDFHDDILNLFLDPTGRATSWEERFGTGNPVADEVFMAWGFARYLGALADAGKRVKALPAYANAWLGRSPDRRCRVSTPAVDRRRGWAASGVPAHQRSTSSRPTSTFQTARR